MPDEVEVSRKVRRAAQMLLLQKHRAPGIKGWELRRALGKDYPKILEILDQELGKLDLRVQRVSDEEVSEGSLSEEALDRARFFIVTRTPPLASDVITSGLRIDDLAVLSASIAYLLARQGKAPRRELDQLLRERLPKWKIDMNLDRFTRRGYLLEDEDGIVHIGWRTRAEIDQKTLLSLILAAPG